MAEQYADIKTRLIKMRDDLSQRLSSIKHDIHHVEKPLASDFEEQAVERENDEVLDALDTATDKELKAINTALRRIENNEYGSCSLCGEPISQKRLEALPYTDLCVACATQQEQQ